MKNLAKLGLAGALALGGSMAAQAAVQIPGSYGPAGDLFLFANVYSGSTLVNSYVGDTGVAVSGSVGAHTFLASSDANLNTLLTQAQAGGNTIVWMLAGGWGQAGTGNPYEVTSASSLAAIHTPNGVLLGNGGQQLSARLNFLFPAASTANSVLMANTSSLNGTLFNPGATVADISNWGNATGNVTTTGLGTSAGLYLMTGGNGSTLTGTFTAESFNAVLSATGLSISSTAVPLPAAAWLLGSGLLGLAGVARRKSVAA